MVNNLKDIISHLMAFIEDDYTELGVIANKVQEENPKLSFVELIEATKEVVQELVDKNNAFVLNEGTQETMNLSVKEVLQLVEERFKTFGKIPNIGDGIWFTVKY
ncbi:MAG: hypothetical protein H0V30_01245 [Chitinophagaceae bacterium]|nr:hypothetical protein [Chitinophagaceae bacterium]